MPPSTKADSSNCFDAQTIAALYYKNDLQVNADVGGVTVALSSKLLVYLTANLI